MEGRGGKGGSIGENDVDGQISEDEKVEKFYALIKSYKDAREQRRIELERQSSAKRKRSTESAASSWIPAFKLEDFAESSQIKFRNSPVSLPASFGSVRDDPSPEGGGLDLRLRL